MRRKRIVVRALAIAAAAAAAVCSWSVPSAQAAPPVGTFLTAAPLARDITVPGAAYGERITYWSTTVGARRAVASAAVYLPSGTPPRGGWPVIAWAHGTTGLADHCAYSIGGPIAVERDWVYLSSWMKQGYAVVAADYAGLGTPGNTPYLNGIVEAHNIVDAVKAARAHNPALARKWVVVGQSQGGGAAVTTARWATAFGGSGLDYRGGVGTGVPAGIDSIFSIGAPGIPPVSLGGNLTVYALYVLSGLRYTYPQWDLNSYLTGQGRYWVDRAEQLCDPALAAETERRHVIIGDLFRKPLVQIPNFTAALSRYVALPAGGFDKPLFIGQGLTDTDIIMPATVAYATNLVARGEPVTFRTYPTDHNGTVNRSFPDSRPFVARLFRG